MEAVSNWENDVDRLISRLGLVSEISRFTLRGLPELRVCCAYAGQDLPENPLYGIRNVTGAGRVFGNERSARALAVAEAAERHAAGEFLNQPMVTCSAEDVPGLTIDLTCIPRCTDEEYNHPECPLSRQDWQLPIRWIQGVDLCSGRKLFLPAVMAIWGMRALPTEKFWYQISTGYAVHSNATSALFHAISEVIERDAIAITWIQQLPLPRLAGTVLDTETRSLADWAERHFMELRLYDATTDMSLPTVYALVRAPYDRRIATVAGCGTGLTLQTAARKAALEAVTIKVWLSSSAAAQPASIAECKRLEDGAIYMAAPERQPAFSFLTDDNGSRRVSDGNTVFACNDEQGLRRLVRILRNAGMEVIAVDRTTRELAAVGLVGLVVIVTRLQPMSLNPFVQYRAHPRLYSAPANMGYRVLAEGELNSAPQPFA